MASTSKVANSNVGTASSLNATPNLTNIQEFNIRVPKNQSKKYHVMRFNANLNVDFSQWRGVKMERENNMKEFRGMDEDMPKFGGGSEYNREIREEVRRKKYGIVAKKYRPEAQPWILKLGGKNGKKFKGIREGGVSENAAFYVFTHAPDGNIEAYPLHEWYNFQPIQRYKTLSAEEAEHEFGRRKKVMNYFSLMMRKRLKGDDDEEQDPEDIKVKGGSKKSKELKISEMEEWINSDDESDSDDDDDGEKKKKNKDDSDDDGKMSKKNKKAADMKKAKKKKKNASDSEAFEESDDGDDEGREMDYDTESSDDEPDKDKELKSVAEEDALRKLLTSDEDDEDEEKKSDASDNEDDEKKNKKKKDKTKDKDEAKDKKKKSKTQDDMKISSSEFSSDSSDSDDDVEAAATSSNNANNKNKNVKAFSTNSSRSGTPTSFVQADVAVKRKMTNMPSDLTASENSNSPNNTPAKRTKIENVPSTFSGAVSHHNKEDGITEEAVRRYLLRKPMTATELLTKFKSKKVNCTSERLVDTMTQILKKINPIKQTIQGKLYLSLKHTQAN